MTMQDIPELFRNRKAPKNGASSVAGFTSIPMPPLVNDYGEPQDQSPRMISGRHACNADGCGVCGR